MTTKHRSDIDGLRAIAVIPVVLFHARMPPFSGGFVGVDVFFVISGYLITRLILADLQADRFSFATFYERRVRRIFPALFATLAVTAIIAQFLLLPEAAGDFGDALVATLFFGSNILFARRSGYFDVPGETRPLLHTWSLSVEEQFYIAYPLFLFLITRYFRRRYALAIAGALLLSFLWGVRQMDSNATAAFFLSPPRVWELLVGALLAVNVLPRVRHGITATLLGGLGLASIAYGVFGFTSATPFPGVNALFPVLGAALVIYSGSETASPFPVARLLSTRPLVFVGLISYSLYLWHWPVFAFAENYLGRLFTLGETFGLFVLCVAIATASWRYVEQPFRHRLGEASFSQRTCFVGGFGALGLAACLGAVIYLGGGLQGRLAPDTLKFYQASRDHNPLRSHCFGGSGAKPPSAAPCTTPALKRGNAYDVLVWGDSHGDALFPAIAMIAEKRGLATREVTKKACPPIIGAERVSVGWASEQFGKSGCSRYNAALMKELREGPRPGLVVIVSRWSMYTETTASFGNGRRVFLIDEQDTGLDVETTRMVLARALEKTVDAITALGIRVLLIGQPPEFFQDPSVCFVERSILRRNASDCLTQPRASAEPHLRASKAILQQVASSSTAATYVSLDSILCDDKVCRAWQDGQPLYADASHLDLAGAKVLGNALAKMPSLASIFVPYGGGSAHAAIPRHPVH
jgi:peptidoglycan/LPS O-acetylase OafA/YrhL